METKTKPPVKRVNEGNLFALLSSMAELNSKNEYCDVTIQVENQSFKTNRFVLAALSEYFHTMFAGNFKERAVGDEPIVLHDMNADAFKLILDFMYSGDVEITRNNVVSLLITADFLELRHPYIETECTKFIHEQIWVVELIPNMMQIFEFSRVTKKTALTDITRKYICQHMAQLSRDDVFEKISYEDMKLILQPECPFWIYNQDIVLNFLMGWVHQSHKERKSHFKELLKLIDLKKISTHCISFLLTSQFEDPKEADDTGSELFSPSFVIDNARSEATITLVIDDFSIFDREKEAIWLKSFPCMIQNLPWQLLVYIEENNNYDDDKQLVVFIECNGRPTIKTWSCLAKCELSILLNYSKIKSKTVSQIFYEQGKSRGLQFSVNLGRRRRKEDEVIIFQAHVNADPPELGTSS